MTKLKIYVAGKLSKDSVFGTHYWREDFVKELEKLSERELTSLDPAGQKDGLKDYKAVFGADVYLISQADVVVVYLSDDISVGGSQEILIAKYFKKPVIGLAPFGGRFNHKNKEMLGEIIADYKHPFVYSTCDIVCDDIEGVAKALQNLNKLEVKTLDLIEEAAKDYKKKFHPPKY